MRFYRIEITDENGAILKIKTEDGPFPLVFSSHNDLGLFKPGAHLIEFDLPLSRADVIPTDGMLKIYGIPLDVLNQASNATLANIRIEAGMMPGFPLATEQTKAIPPRRGLIFEGSIKQAFGSWQGTEQSLELLVSVQLTIKPEQVKQFVFNCQPGQNFSDAIAQTIAPAKMNSRIALDSRLVATEPVILFSSTIESLATALNEQSKKIIKDKNYPGIMAVRRSGGYDFIDNSAPGQLIDVLFNDLIGQPVWLDAQIVQMKLVMRSDLMVGNNILMPKEYISINKSRVIGTVKEQIAFIGTALINQVRHVGNSRQPDANSWVTIVDAVLNIV